MLKKVLSLLVCGIMTVAMTPAFAMADGGSAEREVSTLEELKTALNETNVEIKVNSDIQLDGELNIAKDKTITLNLNGHKLSCQKGNPKTKYAIDNQGTLTIEDKSAEANGTISSRGVSNNGTLTMKGGVSEAIDDGGGAGVWNEGDFVMTGGELKVTGKPVNNIAATPLVSAKADGLGSKVPTVRVSGGKFTSKYTNINIMDGTAEISNVNLSVTEKFWMAFKAEKGADVTLNKVKINAVKGGCADAAGGKVELNDCEFTQTEMADWNSTTLAASNGGVLTVNSGVYKGDATAGYGAYIFNSGGKINIKGGENNFVGHIGGDDFVGIVEGENFEEVCQNIIIEFDNKVKHYFDEKDLLNGFLEVENRKGTIEEFPLTTVSIGAVEVKEGKFKNPLEIGEAGASVKHLAKTICGSTYVINRRNN